MRAFILDGDATGRQRLRSLLAAETEVEVVGESDGSPGVAEALEAAQPQVVFLDPQTGPKDAFRLLGNSGLASAPEVVVVSSTTTNAIQAFDGGAVDYVLKPLRAARLRAALTRVQSRIEARVAAAPALRPEESWLVRFVVRNERHLAVVPVEQVDWMAAAGNYVVLHVGRTTHVLRESLAGLEGRLDPARFARISRSSMVNLDRVVSLTTNDVGESTVLLTTGDSLALTRGVRELQARLELGRAAATRCYSDVA